MASRMLCASRNLAISFRNLTISSGFVSNSSKPWIRQSELLMPFVPTTEIIRSGSFLTKSNAAQIIKASTSVSNAGRKRGRGKIAGKGIPRNLNRGQVIGEGKRRLQLPGLNTIVKDGSKIVEIDIAQSDPEWAKKLQLIRDQYNRGGRRRYKLSNEERGYSGHKLAGRSVGAPDPLMGYVFEGFDTRAVEFKIVNVMRGNLGRYRRHSCFVVTGNGNGVAGFALGKSQDPKAAIRKAKNRAAQKLMTIPICEGRTVYHDFFCQFGDTKIYVYKKPIGHGIKTQRVIKTICQMLGIKDLAAKCEGSTNPQHIVKAFFLGLLQQKTYEQMAEDKKLYLVEFSKDTNFFPKVVGVPSQCRKKNEIIKNEILDFKQYCMNGKVVLRKPYQVTFYKKLPTYNIFLKRAEKRRSHDPIKHDLRTRYGELRSFLTDKYPEARNPPPRVGAESDE